MAIKRRVDDNIGYFNKNFNEEIIICISLKYIPVSIKNYAL